MTGCFYDGMKNHTWTASAGTSATTTENTTEKTTGSTTEASPSGTDPSTTTADPTTMALTTTGVPQCKAAGALCGASNECCGCLGCVDGGCSADAQSCGACATCGDSGDCEPQPGTPCEPADDCTGKVWGAEAGVCFAYAPTAGTCDEGGECAAECLLRGAAIVSCPLCIRLSHNCKKGMPVATIGVETFCHTFGESPGCKQTCEDVSENNSREIPASCDLQGNCVEGAAKACTGGLKCKGAVCADKCVSPWDCWSTNCADWECV